MDERTHSDKQGWRKRFVLIASGQAVSLIGSSAAQFALIWYLASETGSSMVMALSGLAAFLPQFLLGPVAGVWVDRLPRKRVIIASDLFIGSVSAMLAAGFALGRPPHAVIYAVMALRALGGAFHSPATQSAIGLLVPRDELVRVGGFQQLMRSGARMLGPVLGALMYAEMPIYWILLLDLAGALVASAGAAAIDIPQVPGAAHKRRHLTRELAEGARVLAGDRALVVVTLCSMLSMVFFAPTGSLYPLMSSGYFGVSARHGGLVELLYALGLMLSALAAGLVGRIGNKLRMIHLAQYALGLSALGVALLPSSMPGFWAFALLCCAMGASGNLFDIPYVAYIQEHIPREAQGRAFALTETGMSLAIPVGLLTAGAFAERWGVPRWFLLTGLSFLATTTVSALWTRQVQRRIGMSRPDM